ncbi:MAG TPA: pyridoxal-phosphate dependent enzyme [Chloroflexota bacterium]|nr:pyridoxal-phosphate dependent enzyme [Chloroflexota bacterium]HUM69700.1 pyridoxal-phosphate dependent enzyme [Chloroflexota bacterium]
MEVIEIECRACQARRPLSNPSPTCPRCGGQWAEARYHWLEPAEKETVANWTAVLARRGASLWRYRELLPICHPENIITLGEGWTPLLRAHNLGQMLGHRHIYIKDERQGPTGSFKDRQAAIAVSAMKEAGITEAVVASTGNVAIAYSAYCARAGIKLWAFVTSSVPADKMREVALYGSEVIKVAGTYDQAKQIAAEFAASKNLFLDQGIKAIATKEAMKTIAFETAEQLGSLLAGDDPTIPHGNRHPWRAPDWYLQAISGGLGPVGVMKGFAELHQMGLTGHMPKLACFQSSGCAPMAEAFQEGTRQAKAILNPLTDITTLATGIPGEAYEVLYDLLATHGGVIEAIPDADTFHALHTVAKMDGISVEPATAVAFAGLFKLVREGVILPHEVVVINCSGHTFPVEKHIIGEQYTRNMTPANGQGSPINGQEMPVNGREEGLLTALEELDNRVQRIAIIEDNPDAARLIRRILQAQGDFLIDEANNGLDGLRLIQQVRPNLVILDLMMPGLDGFGIVEAMKAAPALHEIPVIVVTAKELSPIERQRLDGKIKALLQKGSFLDSDLLSDIKQALPQT